MQVVSGRVAAAGTVIPILVYERAEGRGSPYVIQGFSATDRGRSKLRDEGLVSLKEGIGRPPVRLAQCTWQQVRNQSHASGDNPRRESKGRGYMLAPFLRMRVSEC